MGHFNVLLAACGLYCGACYHYRASFYTSDRLRAYRARTYRLSKPINTKEQAVAFVNKRGFVYFWPIKGIELPNLWMAVAGDRPVADAHDDPGHVTWGWKDSRKARFHITFCKRT